MKHNKSHLLKLLIFGTLIIIVTASLFITFMNNKSTNKTTPVVTGPKFNLVSTDGLSYTASIATKTDTGTYNTLFERTNERISRFTSTPNDMLSSQIYTGETTYHCSATSCEKTQLNDNTGQYAYDYSAVQIKVLKENAKYVTEQPCSSGTCSVWSWDDNAGLQPRTVKLFIDTSSHRITQVISNYTATVTTVTVTYAYTPVTISIPPLPSEIPTIK